MPFLSPASFHVLLNARGKLQKENKIAQTPKTRLLTAQPLCGQASGGEKQAATCLRAVETRLALQGRVWGESPMRAAGWKIIKKNLKSRPMTFVTAVTLVSSKIPRYRLHCLAACKLNVNYLSTPILVLSFHSP